MDSYRQTLAVHYLGNLRPADTIQLSQRSVRVGSTTSSDFCIPSDSLGEVSDASSLLWQFVTGRSGVVVRNWSSHGHWNGTPFSDVLLKAGDQLTLGAVTLELVPSLTPSAADETPVEAPGCEFEGENPVAEDTVFNSQSSDLPDLPPVEEAKTSGRTPVRRKRRVTGRRRSLLSTECSKDNERPAWVDAFLAEQRTVLVTLREDVDSTRSQISQLGAYWTVRPANESEPVPTAGLPEAWDTFLKSSRFSECSISDITTIDQAIEFVADRLDQLQRERDELETLCHELSAKVETLESDFGDQSKQLREMQTELFTAVTE
ncbi:MAG: hypothetical protein O2931_11930, partial [Planctomycetota bacterium]|nr:hypothetical protein [Planctomycetota bacterium]